jgi:hypothetical protein
MLASNLHLRVHWSRDRRRQPQEFPRLMVVLVIVLALVNVSATLLMFEDWATMTSSMAEFERTITDHLIETSH